MAQRFTFRLATVLRVRRMELQGCQRAVAERLTRIRDMQRQAARLQRQLDSQSDAARATLRAGSLALSQVLWDRHEMTRLRRELAEAAIAIAQEQAALALEQKALTEALQRVRTLERYEERRRAAHDAEQRRIERIAEDELNTQRHGFEDMTRNAAAAVGSEST